MTGGDVVKIAAGLLVLGGSALVAVAAIGVLRLPDLYTRMHAASKAGVVGVGLMLLALAMLAPGLGEALRALATILFFVLTTPVSAHLLAKAARGANSPLWQGTVVDEMPPAGGSTAPDAHGKKGR